MSLNVMVDIMARDMTMGAWGTFNGRMTRILADLQRGFGSASNSARTFAEAASLTDTDLAAMRALQVEIDGITTQIGLLNGVYADAATGMDSMMTSMLGGREASASLNDQLALFQTQLASNQLALDAVNVSLAKHQAQLLAMEEPYATVTTEVEAARNALATLPDAMTAATAQADAQVAALTESINQYTASIAKTQAEIDTLTVQFTDLSAVTPEVAALAAELATLGEDSAAAAGSMSEETQAALATYYAMGESLPVIQQTSVAIGELIDEKMGYVAAAQQTVTSMQAELVAIQENTAAFNEEQAAALEAASAIVEACSEELAASEPIYTQLQAQVAEEQAAQQMYLEASASIQEAIDTTKASQKALNQTIKDEKMYYQQNVAIARQTSAEITSLNTERAADQNALDEATLAQEEADDAARAASYERTMNTMQSIGTAAFGALLVASGVFVATALQQGANLQQSITTLQIDLGATASQYNALTEAVTQQASLSTFSTSQVAQAYQTLGKDGWSLTKILYGTSAAAQKYSTTAYDANEATQGLGEQVLILAQSMGTTTPQAAELLSTAMHTFSNDNLTAQQTTNYLEYALKHGVGSVSDLQSAFSTAGGVISSLHGNIKDFTASLIVMGQAGLKGSSGATALRNMMQRLLDPTNKQLNAMSQLGLVTVKYNNVIPQLEQQLTAAGGSAAKAAAAYQNNTGGLQELYTAAKKLGKVPEDSTFNSWANGLGLLNNAFYDSKGNFKGMGNALEVLSESFKKTGKNPQQLAALLTDLFNIKGGQAGAIISNLKDFKSKYTAILNGLSDNNAASDANKQVNTIQGAFNRLKTTFSSLMGSIGSSAFAQPFITFANHLNTFLSKIQAAIQAHPEIGKLAGQFSLLGVGVGASGLALSMFGPKILGFFAPLGALDWSGIGTGISDVAKGFLNIGPSAAKAASNFAQPFGNAIKNFFAVDPSIPLAGDTVGSLIGGGVSTGLEGSVPEIGLASSGVVSSIGGALGGIIPLVSGILAGAAAPVLAFIGIFGGIAAAVTFIVLSFTKFRKDAAAAFKKLWEHIKPVVDTLIALFKKMVSTIVGEWNQNWPKLSAAMKKLWAEIGKMGPFFQLIGTIVGALVGGALILLGALIAGIINVIPDILNFVAGVLGVFGGFFQLVDDLIHGRWQAAWNDVLHILSSAWLAIKSFGKTIEDFFGGVFNFLGSMIMWVWNNVIKKHLLDFVNGVSKWFEWMEITVTVKVATWVLGVVTWFQQLQIKILTTIASWVSTGVRDVEGFINGVINFVAKMVSNVLTAFTNMKNAVVTFFQTLWNNVSSAVNSFISNISGAFQGLVSGAVKWGEGLINGFIQGIKNAAGNIGNTISGVIGTIKGFLGFHSPAKEGEGRHIVEWGQNMILGFMQGIQNKEPDLQNLLSGILKAPALTPATLGITGSSAALQNSTTITVPVQLDGKVIATVVAQYNGQQLRRMGSGRVGM